MAQKFCAQICLLKQDYVADGEITVEKYLENISKEIGSPVTIKRFARMQLGA
jgi:elongation factor Ts